MRTAFALALAAAVGALSGCATTPGPTGALADDTDYEKIALVNQWASRNNVEVRWVNYPRKAKAATK